MVRLTGYRICCLTRNRYVRGDAVYALYRIGTPEAKSVLLRHLQTTRWCPITSSESTF